MNKHYNGLLLFDWILYTKVMMENKLTINLLQLKVAHQAFHNFRRQTWTEVSEKSDVTEIRQMYNLLTWPVTGCTLGPCVYGPLGLELMFYQLTVTQGHINTSITYSREDLIICMNSWPLWYEYYPSTDLVNIYIYVADS